jgi:hypothetical protein
MMPDKPCKRKIDYKRIYTILFLVLGIAFLIWGTGKIINQHQKNTSFLPVKAIVLSTDINRYYNNYWPVVNYEYQVGDKIYRSSNVFSMSRSFGKDWARDVAGQYKEDSGCNAFYDPKNPADAYLVKYYQFTPYGINCLSLLFFLVALIVQYERSFEKIKEQKRLMAGKFWIPPVEDIREEMKSLLYFNIIALVVLVPTLVHYFKYAEPPYNDFILLVFALYIVFLGGFLYTAYLVLFKRENV